MWWPMGMHRLEATLLHETGRSIPWRGVLHHMRMRRPRVWIPIPWRRLGRMRRWSHMHRVARWGGGPLIDLRILGRLTLLMNLCMTLEIRLYGESPPARGLLTHKWPFSGICG